MVTVVLGLPPPPGLLPLGLFPLRLFPARMMPSLCVAGNEDTGKRPFGWEMWRKCECNVVGRFPEKTNRFFFLFFVIVFTTSVSSVVVLFSAVPFLGTHNMVLQTILLTQ